VMVLRTVTGREEGGALPWTGSWTESPVQTVQSEPSAARSRGIYAASASRVAGHASHNPPVVGSSPTRPTRSFNVGSAMALDRRQRGDSSSRQCRSDYIE
jgi:hypothetical protein